MKTLSKGHRFALSSGLLITGLLGLALPGYAARTVNSPPIRVARLNVLQGNVGLLLAQGKQWSQAVLNVPLTSGDKLWVPKDGRVSMQLGGAEIRLAGDTGFGFLHLGNDTAQSQLTQGSLNLRIRKLFPGQSFEIDTPTLAFVTRNPGEYRLDISPDGRGTQITVFRGQAQVYGEHQAKRRVYADNSYRFNSPRLTQVEILSIPQPDRFDRWSFALDTREQRAYANRQYVSSAMIGYEDLDEYGNWINETEYGPVWFPNSVSAGWVPYRDGRWIWMAPWGWTWVDSQPWGFAPFHYGRWAWIGGNWGWLPGPLGLRPVYAPALVAFVGGSGWGMGFNTLPIGWYPLGPGQIYMPWYPVGFGYFNRVNITNVNIVNTTIIQNYYNIYRRGGKGDHPFRGNDGHPPHGMSWVPENIFLNGQSVNRHVLRPSHFSGAWAQRLQAAHPPRPLATSLRIRGNGSAPLVPGDIFRRQVWATHRPSPHHTVPGEFFRSPKPGNGNPGQQLGSLPFTPLNSNHIRVIGHPGRTLVASLPRPQRFSGKLSRFNKLSSGKRPLSHTPPRVAIQSNRGRTALRSDRLSSSSYAPHRWAHSNRPALSQRPSVQPDRHSEGPRIRRKGSVSFISGTPQPTIRSESRRPSSPQQSPQIRRYSVPPTVTPRGKTGWHSPPRERVQAPPTATYQPERTYRAPEVRPEALDRRTRQAAPVVRQPIRSERPYTRSPRTNAPRRHSPAKSPPAARERPRHPIHPPR